MISFPSRELLAWAAGVFEGEGWISLQGKSPSMGIQMCDRDVLEKFSYAVGGGPIYYRNPRNWANNQSVKSKKDQWAWRITGFEKVQAVVSYLWPWLCSRRRGRIKEVLAIALTGQVHGGMKKGYKTQKALNRPHGDVRKYWQGCRCESCMGASRLYARGRRAPKKWASI